jgi:hypothetical protein
MRLWAVRPLVGSWLKVSCMRDGNESEKGAFVEDARVVTKIVKMTKKTALR